MQLHPKPLAPARALLEAALACPQLGVGEDARAGRFALRQPRAPANSRQQRSRAAPAREQQRLVDADVPWRLLNIGTDAKLELVRLEAGAAEDAGEEGKPRVSSGATTGAAIDPPAGGVAQQTAGAGAAGAGADAAAIVSNAQRPAVAIPWGCSGSGGSDGAMETKAPTAVRIPWGETPGSAEETTAPTVVRIPWGEASGSVKEACAGAGRSGGSSALAPPVPPDDAVAARIGRVVYVFAEEALVSEQAAAERDMEIEDDFFEFDAADFARNAAAAAKRAAAPQHLKTASMREAEARSRAEKLPPTRVRLVLPDRTCVAAEFNALEPLAAMHAFAGACLAEGAKFELYTTPPHVTLRASTTVTLYGARLCPAAVVRVAAADGTTTLSLRADLAASTGPPPQWHSGEGDKTKRQRTAAEGRGRGVGGAGGSSAPAAAAAASGGRKKKGAMPAWFKMGGK